MAICTSVSFSRPAIRRSAEHRTVDMGTVSFGSRQESFALKEWLQAMHFEV